MSQTNETIKKLLAVYKGYWPRAELTEAMVPVWTEAFSGHSAKLVLAGIKLCGEREDWPPSIAQIKTAMREVAGKKRTTKSDAWEERRISKDPLVRKAYRMWGGYDREGQMADPNPQWNPDWQRARTQMDFARKEFLEIYNDVCESANTNESLTEIGIDTAKGELTHEAKEQEARRIGNES